MNFRESTDQLIKNVTLENLAKTMGVSVQSLRQARMSPDSSAYRRPPNGWEFAVCALAKDRIAALQNIINSIS